MIMVKSDLQMSYVNILRNYIDNWRGIFCFEYFLKTFLSADVL